MLRSFGIPDDENLSSILDNTCETNRCPTAQRQGRAGDTFVHSANVTSRLSTPPPSFSPLATSTGHGSRRRVCPSGTTRSPPTPYPDRGGCPYAYSDESYGSSTLRNGTYSVNPGDVSSAFYGLSDSEYESSTLNQSGAFGGEGAYTVCPAGNRSGRRLSFEDTRYQSPVMGGVNFPSGSMKMSPLQGYNNPRVEYNNSYISSTASYNDPFLYTPPPSLRRNPTMFDAPRGASSKSSLNVYDDNANLSTINEYDDEPCTDQSCPSPSYGSSARGRTMGNTYTVPQRNRNATYTASPRRLNQTYSISSAPYYSSSCSDYTPPNFYTPPSRYGEWSSPPFHSTTIGSSGTCNDSVCSGKSTGGSRSRSHRGGYSGGDQSSSLGILGSGYLDSTRTTTDQSSLGLLSCRCLESTPVDDSSLGILNSSLMRSSRNTTQDSSLGILSSGCFESTPVDESSLGILNSSLMRSSRNTTQDSSLGILSSSFMDSSGSVMRCRCGPDRNRTRSAEPSERYTKKEKKVVHSGGKRVVRTSSTTRVTHTVPAVCSQSSSQRSPPAPRATVSTQAASPSTPPCSRTERSVQSAPCPRRNKRIGSDTSLTTTLQAINGRLTTIENNVVEIAARIRELQPPQTPPRRRPAGQCPQPCGQGGRCTC